MNLAAFQPYLKDPWTISWLVSGAFAIFLPLIIWSSNKSSYYSAYGSAKEAEDYYEQEQEYYKEQQEYYEQQQNNNNNYYNNYQEQTYYKDCSWFNWACRKSQWDYATYDENGGDEDSQTLPGWFVFLGGETEEMQRWKEENTGIRTTSSSAGLNFVYFLTLLLFVALLGYGAVTIGKKLPVTNLVMLLGIMTIIGLMNLIMNVQGVISSDDKDLEDSYYGWYGQMGVLLVYTNFWIMLFCLVFCAAFILQNYLEKRNEKKEVVNSNNIEGSEYYAPTEGQMN